MKRLKTFEKFVGTEVKPTVKPGVKPSTTPSRPSPIRRNAPSVKPAPKAVEEYLSKKGYNKAKGEDIVAKYNELKK